MSQKPKDEQASDKSGGLVVRLPLSAAEIATLKAEALAQDRPVSAEIARRVLGKAPGPSPFAGWPTADAQTFQYFGDAAARLLADVTQAAGTKTSLTERLGYMRVALTVLLDELGAEVPDEEAENFFRSHARSAITDDWLIEFAASETDGQYVETPLARIVRELKAAPAADQGIAGKEKRK